MEPLTTTCPRCGKELQPSTVLALASNDVAVTIEEAPLRRCPDGHVTFDVRAGFPDEVVADVLAALLMPSRRWFSRSFSCGSCGEFLTMPARHTVRSVTVALADAPVFTVRIELPMRRCSSCGLDNVAEQRVGRVEAVLREALANRGLAPTPR